MLFPPRAARRGSSGRSFTDGNQERRGGRGTSKDAAGVRKAGVEPARFYPQEPERPIGFEIIAVSNGESVNTRQQDSGDTAPRGTVPRRLIVERLKIVVDMLKALEVDGARAALESLLARIAD